MNYLSPSLLTLAAVAAVGNLGAELLYECPLALIQGLHLGTKLLCRHLLDIEIAMSRSIGRKNIVEPAGILHISHPWAQPGATPPRVSNLELAMAYHSVAYKQQ